MAYSAYFRSLNPTPYHQKKIQIDFWTSLYTFIIINDLLEKINTFIHQEHIRSIKSGNV